MKRKHQYLALAVAGALASPVGAMAQTNVQIYGTLNVNFQNTERGGATNVGTPGMATLSAAPTGVNATSRNAVSTDSSNIGFRGMEDLGGGLKAVWQVETSANVDGNNLAAIGNRNSKIGLAGSFGEVFFGNWDTPYKAGTYGTAVGDPFGQTDVFGFQSIMSSPGFNQRSGTYVSGTNNASFDNRANNTVAYWSPTYNGFSGKLAYSANEGKTATRNPNLWSLTVNYNNGPLSVLYSYERHNDAFGLTVMQAGSTGTSSRDSGHRLGAGYKFFGNTTASILWERLDYDNSGTVAGVTSYKRDAWQLGVLHELGSHKFRLRYNQAQDGSCSNVAGNCTTSGLGARQWTLGYGYSLSKRTEGYLFYTKIANRKSASYTMTIGGAAGVVTGPGVGSDPQALGVGIRHNF
ncbi:Outer membrane porin protein 32 [Geobacteraceae bacterium]|jgi:predicted porin|nr:Outer membrane porin protein 32 [Geobacteraceae bacterium]